VDLVFRRSIDFFVIGSMMVNTIIITTHLNTVIEKHTRSSLNKNNADLRLEDEENESSSEIIHQRRAKMKKNANHAKFKKGELLQVKLQGAFFIGSYVVCNFATIVLQMIVAEKSKGSYQDEMEVPYNYFFLMVLQAILFPLLGFLNCIAYMKPSLTRTRSQHKNESMLWVFRRSVFGDSVAPTCKAEGIANNMKQQASRPTSMRQPKKVCFRQQDEENQNTEKVEGSGRTDETSGSDNDTREINCVDDYLKRDAA